MYNFMPEPYDKNDDIFDELEEKLGVLDVSNVQTAPSKVFVTCKAGDEDSEQLVEGMKIEGEHGFSVSNFPWTEDKDWSDEVVIDFSESRAVKDSNEVEVKVDCLAWAKNIDRKERTMKDIILSISMKCR